MRKIIFISMIFGLFACKKADNIKELTISQYEDKVKGGWAGKMIGVEYGMPFEFKYQGKFNTTDTIKWTPEQVKGSLANDDLYAQLGFMMVLDSLGLEAPASAFAERMANAKFPLCHANLQARRNYYAGIMPPLSGSPEYNMHADDIDFQIDADFIGFINPGMPQNSNVLCDRIGHVMNYGDGVYGGMFVAAMHSVAFFESDVVKVVKEGLKAIPAKSQYAQCVQDIIDGWQKNPKDWTKTWQIVENKYGKGDICVPYIDFNIDAKINGAYIALALLYGNGDFENTMEIAVRCGQDADCNPSNAAGILGVIKGYKGIEDKWKSHIPKIADSTFVFTNYTLNKAVKNCWTYAKQNVAKCGGSVKNDTILVIKTQIPTAPVKLEQSFPDIKFNSITKVTDSKAFEFKGKWRDYVIGRGDNEIFKQSLNTGDEMTFKFKGKAVLLQGYTINTGGKADVYIDGVFSKTIDFWYRDEAGIYEGNRCHVFHKLNLEDKEHSLRLVVCKDRNPLSKGNNVWVQSAIVYK